MNPHLAVAGLGLLVLLLLDWAVLTTTTTTTTTTKTTTTTTTTTTKTLAALEDPFPGPKKSSIYAAAGKKSGQNKGRHHGF